MRLEVPNPTPFIGHKGIIIESGYEPIIVDYRLESGLDGVGISAEILDDCVVGVHIVCKVDEMR